MLAQIFGECRKGYIPASLAVRDWRNERTKKSMKTDNSFSIKVDVIQRNMLAWGTYFGEACGYAIPSLPRESLWIG